MFSLGQSFDDFIDLINFLSSNRWEHVLDLNDIRHAGILFGNLSVRLVGFRDFILHLFILKILGDCINFLLIFGQNRRRNPLDASWDGF